MQAYERLENIFAKYVGTKYAVSCNSGTAALHLALLSLGVGEGDEVIVPEFTMASTAFAVSYTGANPIFVDCGDDYNIDTNLVHAAVTVRTKAIMATHIYGRVADIEALKQHSLPVIEDACEAHGATLNGRYTGSLGNLGCFSFYKNKLVAAEEGGIVTTDNEELANKMRSFKNMCFEEPINYMHTAIGYNYRMPNNQAILALESLISLDIRLNSEDRRRGGGGVKWVQDVLCLSEEERDEHMIKLVERGKKVRHFFKPMSMLPMYSRPYEHLKAYDFSKRGFYVSY